MEKQKFIESINSKGLSNSLISIYYNIGRALPFIAQRYPDGRVSDWYRSQYVEVISVKPSGKGGIYGKAYGFYYRNGERADSSDDNKNAWCRKDDVEPQKIPYAACGSWILLDILGEQTTETTKIYRLDDILDFGKYQGKTLKEIIHTDYNWVDWAIKNSGHFHCDLEEVNKERLLSTKVLQLDDVLTFGKYKGKTIKEVIDLDIQITN